MFITRFQSYCILVGRLLLAGVFFGSGLFQLTHFAQVRELMLAQGMPSRPVLLGFLLGLAILLQLAGALLIAVGLKVQFGALFLIAFLTPATATFHPFWNYTPDVQWRRLTEPQRAALDDPAARERWRSELQQIYDRQESQFIKNIGLAGGLLILMAFGAGPISLDARYGDGTGIPFRDEFGNPL